MLMTLIVLAWSHPSDDQQKDVNQIKLIRKWNYGFMVFKNDTNDKNNNFSKTLCLHKEVERIVNCL